MKKPFPAYTGDSNYIFVCYSHDDAHIVYPELVLLRERGFNIWYDEGIPAGHEWTDVLAGAIARADCLLFFVSDSSVQSRYCRDEVHYALDQGREVLPIHVRQTQLPAGLVLSLGSTQAIQMYEQSEDRYREKLWNAVSQLKHPGSRDRGLPDPARELAGLIQPERLDIAIACSTEWRGRAVDSTYNIGTLFGSTAQSGDVKRSSTDDCWRGGQQAVYDALEERITQNPGYPQRLTVTGIAGAGKSVTLRRLSIELAARFKETGYGPLPIYIPFGRIGFGTQGNKALTWQAILDRWLEWGVKIIAQYATEQGRSEFQNIHVDASWYEQRLDRHATVLIIDGIDEFLSRDPNADLGRLIKSLATLEDTFAHNGKLTIILGVRNTQTGLKSLIRDSHSHYEVIPLSLEEAEEFAPGVSAVIGNVKSKTARQAILTPLILFNLKPAIASGAPNIHTHAGFLRSALDGLLDWNGVTEINEFVDALTLIAWRLFVGLRGEISFSSLAHEIELDAERWISHLQSVGRSPEYDRRYQSYQRLKDPKFIQELSRRTVLVSNGGDNITFIHQEWEDFLIAQFFTDSLRAGDVDIMAHRAFNANHFHLAAQLLKSYEVDANLVNQVLVRTKELAERFIIGNFVALIGFCRNRMTAPAIRLLLTSLDAMDPLARHVGLTLMGSRALAGDPDDVAAPHLRKMLHQAFDRLLTHDEATRIPAATLSMAWCYMSVFAGKYDLKPPPVVYPVLNPAVAEEVLSWVCDPSKLMEEPSAQFRSLQLAYLEELKQIPEKAEQGITAMHYLWFLSVGYANLVSIPEVSETLPALLASDSKIADFVASINPTPELRLVFEACQTVANVR